MLEQRDRTPEELQPHRVARAMVRPASTNKEDDEASGDSPYGTTVGRLVVKLMRDFASNFCDSCPERISSFFPIAGLVQS